MKHHQKVWFDHHGWLPDWKGKREVIHHKDGDHSNNCIDNLEVITQSEHVRLHNPRLGVKATEEERAKLSAAKLGNKNRLGVKHTEEGKAKIAAGVKKNWERPERKAFIRDRGRTTEGKFK